MSDEAPRRRIPWRLAALAAAALAVATSPWWGPAVLRQMDFFRVRRIELQGLRYIPPAELLDRLAVDTTRSVWHPLEPLEARVAAHPEVLSVEVDRRLPGTLVVSVRERAPVALVPGANGMVAYDERGVALPIDPSKTPVDAPILAARDTTLIRLLATLQVELPALYARISELRRVRPDELLFQLGHLPVLAPAPVTVTRLAELEPVERDLARRRLAVAELDLRFRDQVIARLQ